MATTVSLLSVSEVPDNGGALVAVRVNWTSGDTILAPNTALRLVVCREDVSATITDPTDPPTLVDIGPSATPLLCYSGVPEQSTTLYHNDPEAVDDDAKYVIGSGATATFQPKWQWVRAYTPRLAPGLHYLRFQRYDTGTSTWVDVVADSYPRINVLYRNRPGEVYAMRQNFPNPPYNPGPQTSETDPILGG